MLALAHQPSLDSEWTRMKRAIGLANAVASPNNAAAMRSALKRATEESVDRCRAERKKQRAQQVPKDLSDEAIAKAAKWTDGLPLAEYEGILHLVPRLVNVVTVRASALEPSRVVCSRACARSSPRPSPSPARASSCRSTCTPSARAARMPTLRRAGTRMKHTNESILQSCAAFWCPGLPPCSSPLTRRAAACSSSTPAA